MVSRELESKYRIVAGSRSLGDFLTLLQAIRAQTADIQIPLSPQVKDSIEIRQALALILSESIDKLDRLANTGKHRPENAPVGQDF